MPKLIYTYTQIKDEHTVKDVEIFSESENEVTPICEIENSIYCAIGHAVDVSAVDADFNLQLVTLTPSLLEQIKAASPVCQLIKKRKEDLLDSSYDLQARLSLSELSQGIALGMIDMTDDIQQQLQAYKVKVQYCNAWEAQQYIDLGLVLDAE